MGGFKNRFDLSSFGKYTKVTSLVKRLQLPWIPGMKRPNFMFYRLKVTIPTEIPSSVIFALIYLSMLYIFSGGVYDLVEEPFARGSDSQGNPVLLYSDQDRQFLLEGIVAGVIMFLGATGLYLLSQATTDPHNPNRATTYQTLGVILLVLSFLILQTMFNCKLNPSNC